MRPKRVVLMASLVHAAWIDLPDVWIEEDGS